MQISKSFLVLLTTFLVGCGIRTPVGPVHMSSKTYFCRGQWHYPQNYYEYDEVGIASWYGYDCHGKLKANGEKFNKTALTAAHKTLPIPSVVKVTSYKTGKSVIVVIDDRGPFVYRGRIIDLSYNAAKELGIHKFKPSPVRVQTLVEDSLKLSHYIARHCKKRRDPKGRSWAELYFQEIKGKRNKSYTEVKFDNKSKETSSTGKSKKHNSLGSYLNRMKI